VTVSEYSAIVEFTDTQNQLALARRNVKNKIKAAIDFGEKIALDFTTENVLLGITQDNMTSYVLERMSGVLAALQTGSLYDAIAKAKSIPVSSYDIKYITAARLLKFVNNIESYLGRPLSTSL
jgi:hypothetical protein